jgi:hypothetical protein
MNQKMDVGCRGYQMPCCKIHGNFLACDIIDNLHHGQFKCGLPTIVLGVQYKRKFPQTFECEQNNILPPKETKQQWCMGA